MQSINLRATIVSLVLLLTLLAVWEILNQAPAASSGLSENEQIGRAHV